MTNIKNLTKIYLKSFFVSKSKNKSTSFSKVSKIAFVLIIAALVVVSLGVNYYSMGILLQSSGKTEFVLYFGFLYFTLLSITFLSYHTQNMFFDSKDYDLLAAMPIKSHEIIISKILSLLVTSYFYEIVFVAPSAVVFFMLAGFNAITLLLLLLCLIILPFFSLFLSAVLIVAVNAISARAQNKKRVNSIILSILSVAMIFLFIFLNSQGMLVLNGGIPKWLNIIFPLNTTAFYAITSHSIVDLLITISVNLLLFAGSVWILAGAYFKINRQYQDKSKKLKQKLLTYKKSSVLKSLTRLEIKSFFSMPIYVINAGFGSMFLVIASIFLPVYFFTKTGEISSIIASVPMNISFNQVICAVLIIIPLFMLALSNTTCSAFSLEGTSFDFRKGLPISFKDIILSKLNVNFMVCSTYLLYIAATLPIMIYVKCSIFLILLSYLAPVLMVAFMTQMGLMINLWYPKLVWSNSSAVIKQSMSVFLTNMIGVLLPVGIIVLFTWLKIDFTLYLILLNLFLTVISILMYVLINTKGRQIYYNLQS